MKITSNDGLVVTKYYLTLRRLSKIVHVQVHMSIKDGWQDSFRLYPSWTLRHPSQVYFYIYINKTSKSTENEIAKARQWRTRTRSFW